MKCGRVAVRFHHSSEMALRSEVSCCALPFFMSLMLVYLFVNWIPLLLRQAGLPLEQALLGTIIFNLAGIIGSIVHPAD
jgi:MFS transporter, AAHS family, 4-hydroxybenzoate transporter